MISSAAERGAVFVDRDGVICQNRDDYVKSWAEFDFVPGSIEALAALTRTATRLYVFTNQSVVGRGLITRRTLDTIHEKMRDVLAGNGVKIAGILVCPHHPDDDCGCRKPQPGLLYQAEREFKVDLSRSFVIGDALSDVEAGAVAGCTTILVKSGRGAAAARARGTAKHKPDFIADDLVDAAIWVMAQQAAQIGARTEVRSR